jgi:hypothetical protein
VNPSTPAEDPSAVAELQLHRLCTFELDLTCGHCVTVSLNGWYPVVVACCDRLGGIWSDGTYYAFTSEVDDARCLTERYEHRPPGARREPTVLLNRRPRTDDPSVAANDWQWHQTGRFPQRVGGPYNTPHPEGAS